MALIKCPECGNMVSDKASACPKCGYPINGQTFDNEAGNEYRLYYCKSCKHLFNGKNTNKIFACPKCKNPLTKTVIKSEDWKNFSKSKKQSTARELLKGKYIDNGDKHNTHKFKASKRIIIALVIIACLFIAGFSVFCSIKKHVITQNTKLSNDYQSNLNSAVQEMYLGASTAEVSCTLIHDVWYDSIFGNYYNEETSTYLKGTDDFNDALSRLFDDQLHKNRTGTIESTRENVKEYMRALQNPPDKFVEAYSSLKELYSSYMDLTECALNPTGNLENYTESFNNADNNFSTEYEAMSVFTTQ